MGEIDQKTTNIRRAVETGDMLEAGNILCNSSINEWNEISKKMLEQNRREQRSFRPSISMKDSAEFSIVENVQYSVVIPLITVDREYCRNLNYKKGRGHFDLPLTKHF